MSNTLYVKLIDYTLDLPDIQPGSTDDVVSL
jgi:hypothetical protein